MSAEIAPFGVTPEGGEVERITLRSDALSVSILTTGAILQDVRLAGIDRGLTLNADSLEPYLAGMAVFGSVIGPVVNRIGGATAAIGGRTCRFEANIAGGHTLHSGAAGTHRKLWTLEAADARSARLSVALPDGDGGFPGARRVVASYAVDGPALTLQIEATTDRPTLFNFANHSYWNLDGSETTADHRLRVAAERVLVSGEATLPTGEIADVAGTRFDFREPSPLPASPERRLDHNFCLSDARRDLSPAAELVGASGVTMTLETTEPGLQVYDGEGLPGEGQSAGRFPAFAGVALEAQAWPDAPNNPQFPSIVTEPGETYRQTTRWTFRRP